MLDAYLWLCKAVGFVVVTGSLCWLLWFIGYIAYWGWYEHRYTSQIYENWKAKNER